MTGPVHLICPECLKKVEIAEKNEVGRWGDPGHVCCWCGEVMTHGTWTQSPSSVPPCDHLPKESDS